MKEAIRHHAAAVQQDGAWLTILDLVLLAEIYKRRMLLTVYNQDCPLKVQSAEEWLQHVCPTFLTSVEATAPAWHIALHNINFEPTDDLGKLNHWAPAWSQDEIGKANFDVQYQAQVASLQQQLLVARNSGQPDANHLARVERQLQFAKELKLDIGWVCGEVRGDGNCGLYSLLALENKTHLPQSHCVPGQFQVDDAAARRLRSELSQSWLRVLNEACREKTFFHVAKQWPWPISSSASTSSTADGCAEGNQQHAAIIADGNPDQVAKQFLQHLGNHVEQVPAANDARSAGLVRPRVASHEAPQREIEGFNFDAFMCTPVKQKVDIIKAGVCDGDTPAKAAAKVKPCRRQTQRCIESADLRKAGVDYLEWQKVHSENMKRKDRCLDLSDIFRQFALGTFGMFWTLWDVREPHEFG